MTEIQVSTPDYYRTQSGDLIDNWVERCGSAAAQWWCFFSADKYLYRVWNKGTPKENIDKAIVCLNRFLELGGDRAVQSNFEPSSTEIELLAEQGCVTRIDAYVAEARIALEEWTLQRGTESIEVAVRSLHKARWAIAEQERLQSRF